MNKDMSITCIKEVTYLYEYEKNKKRLHIYMNMKRIKIYNTNHLAIPTMRTSYRHPDPHTPDIIP